MVVLFLFMFVWRVEANTEENAAAFIERLAAHALALVNDRELSDARKEERLREMMRYSFDWDFIARFILARTWHGVHKDSQNEIVAVVQEYLIVSQVSKVGLLAGASYRLLGERAIGMNEDTLVQMSVTTTEKTFGVVWRVRHKDNNFKIVDVEIEGISMLQTQRAEFGSVISREGLDGLLSILRKKVEAAKDHLAQTD